MDDTLNPALADIQQHYIDKGNHFFVAEVAGKIIATCALTHEMAGMARIERMSVKQAWWGSGFGRKSTHFLINFAHNQGYKELVVETNMTWKSAIHLYRTCGFLPEHEQDGEIHMRLKLTQPLTS